MVIHSIIPSANSPPFSKQTVEGFATGLTDFTLSQLLVLQKLRIQAGKSTNKQGEKKFLMGFFVSTVGGQVLANYNSTLATVSAVTLSIGTEALLRPSLTGSKPTISSVVSIILREAVYWSSVTTSNHVTKQKDSSPFISFMTQFMFAGVLANTFDTIAGKANSNELSISELQKDIQKNTSEYIRLYKKSLPKRIAGCVVTPFLAAQLTLNPKSPFQEWLKTKELKNH